MNKKGLIIGIAAAIAVFFAFNGFGDSKGAIEANWELKLPKGNTEVYNFATETAAYYAVIYEKAEDAEGAFAWQEEEGETLASGSYSKAIDAWMEEAEVPNTLPIDIERGPYHYMTDEEGNELLIVLDNRMLHFVEHTGE